MSISNRYIARLIQISDPDCYVPMEGGYYRLVSRPQFRHWTDKGRSGNRTVTGERINTFQRNRDTEITQSQAFADDPSDDFENRQGHIYAGLILHEGVRYAESCEDYTAYRNQWGRLPSIMRMMRAIEKNTDPIDYAIETMMFIFYKTRMRYMLGLSYLQTLTVKKRKA